MAQDSEQAWGDFWAQQRAQGGGCLPDQWQGIDAVQQKAWHKVAERLPEKARLLDLATGDGRVMRWILHAREDVQATGVDLAPQLPAPPQGTQVHAGVAMERLPFEDASFDCVVSQFGFEYGEVAQVASEIARVLAPGGFAALMTHRLDGPILAHNKARRMQIGWALERKSVIGLARKCLTHRTGRPAGVPMQLVEIVREGAHRFGQTSAAWEIPEAVRRTLAAPAHVPTAQVEAALDKIAAQAANEIGRISSLEQACKVAADAEALTQAFADADLKQVELLELSDSESTSPFADFRTIHRA